MSNQVTLEIVQKITLTGADHLPGLFQQLPLHRDQKAVCPASLPQTATRKPTLIYTIR